MRRFRDQPIRRKLLTIILATVAASLTLVMAGLVVYETFVYRDRLSRQMSVAAAFIAANSAPSLSADNPRLAHETLRTLKLYPEIVLAALYDEDVRIFAAYHPRQKLVILRPRPPTVGIREDADEWEIVRPVEQKGERIGTLVLRAVPDSLPMRLIPYAGILLVAALAIGGGAFLLLRLLRRMISRPLLQLAKTAERIAGGEWTARAGAEADDEIGQLAQAFNRMTAELSLSEKRLRAAFDELRQSQERIARTESFALVMTLHVALDGRWLKVTPTFCNFLGYPEAEILGRSFREFTHPDDFAADWEQIQRLVRGDMQTIELEKRFIRRDGRIVWGYLNCSIVAAAAGQPLYFLAYVRDITAHKQVEVEIRQLTAELEERVAERTAELTAANRELEAFSYTISHDLRAPLRHVTGFVNLLQDRAAAHLDAKEREYLQHIAAAAGRMGDLIESLLAFSRLCRVPLTLTPVDLRRLVEEVRAELTPETQGRAIVWQVEPLPVVTGDAVLLRSVLVNLLANAVKYTRQRQPAVIDIGSRPEQGEIIVYVRDNGAGFDMRFADRLFGVFQRLHPAQQFEGTGIGLASVRRIVERHGGRVWAEAAVEEGATFYFTLPAEQRRMTRTE